MLAGTESMMQGGVVSAEAVAVLILAGAGVSIPLATMISMGVRRLTTHWLAIAFGFLALATWNTG
jgi:uncharacterized membrane protein YbhN (UPF0104 family)